MLITDITVKLKEALYTKEINKMTVNNAGEITPKIQ